MCLEELDHCLCSLAAAVESLSIYRTAINVFGGAGSLFMFPSSSCRKLEYIIEQLLMCLEELDHCLCSLAAAVES